MKPLMCLSICLALASCSNSMPRTSAKPPATRAEPVEETLHGVAVTDRYRWLEGDNSDPTDQGKVTPDVAGWTDAQNSYTRSVLDNLPGRKALEERLRPLMEVGAVTRPIVRANRYFFSKREGNQNQPVVYWREGYKGENKVLIDPARLDDSGLTTVEWFSPSQDGKLLAYGTYRAGDEITTLHLLEVDSSTVARSRDPRQDPVARLASRRLGVRLSEPEEPQGSVHRSGPLPPDGHRSEQGRAPLPPVHQRGKRQSGDHVGTIRKLVARRPLARARLLDRHEVE